MFFTFWSEVHEFKFNSGSDEFILFYIRASIVPSEVVLSPSKPTPICDSRPCIFSYSDGLSTTIH